MATSHVETVEHMLAAFTKGDMPTMSSFYHSEFTVHPPEGLPYSGTVHNMDGFMSLLSKMGGLLELELKERTPFDGGERVFLQMAMTFTSRHTGRSTTTSTVEVYQFEDGLISQVDVYYKDANAVAAILALPDAAAVPVGDSVPVSEGVSR